MEYDMTKKGQILIIIGIVIFLVLAAVRIESDGIKVVESQRAARDINAADRMANIVEAVNDAINIAFANDAIPETAVKSIKNMTDLLQKSEDISVLFVVSSYRPPSVDLFNVSVGNFLSEDIHSVSFAENFSGSASTTQIGEIRKGDVATKQVSVASLSNTVDISVNVSYTRALSGTSHKVSYTMTAGPGFNYTAAYAAIRAQLGGTLLVEPITLTVKANRTKEIRTTTSTTTTSSTTCTTIECPE